MSLCRLCQKRDANSKEHVIPSALGGVLQLKDVLCVECNGKCGSGIDAELIRSFDVVRMLLDITGDRGQKASVEGHDPKLGPVILDSGGKPRAKKQKPKLISENTDGSKTYRVASIKEARQFLDAERRKNPETPLVVRDASVSSEFAEMIHLPLSFGGDDFYRSCVKTVLTFLIHCGIEWDDSNAWRYVAGDKSKELHVRALMAHSTPLWIPSDRLGPLHHSILIQGLSSANCIRAEVRFFGGVTVAVELDAAFVNDFQVGYAVDPLTGAQENVRSWPQTLDSPPHRIDEETIAATGNVMRQVLKMAYERQTARATEEIVERGLRKAFAGLKEGDPIPPGALSDLAEHVAVDFALHVTRTDWEDSAPELAEQLNRKKS